MASKRVSSLPLTAGVKIAKYDPFDGLFGIFADSLPDGWNRLLVDRMLRKAGEDPGQITSLQRLSIVGDSGMGALEYRPVHHLKSNDAIPDLDRLAAECRKILLKLDGGEWIVKFPSSGDPEDIGLMEYRYNLCAKACGIDIPEVRLFPSSNCAGYFGSKRFDRKPIVHGESKVHMASASALLEISHRVPALDYSSLMSLTWQLTKQADELKKLFTLMCFNVFAHNRDDHSNNFSFLCDNGKWRMAPAYDLTYSNSIGGEHATTIAGEGRNPVFNDILKVARKAGIKESLARQIAEQVEETVHSQLSDYLR